MPKTILQKVIFKNTDAGTLYNLYINSKKHTSVTGQTAKITNTEGSIFSAYDGNITGKNLQLVKDQLIVQSWRDKDWPEDTMDSTLILHLKEKGKNVVLRLIHANVPKDMEARIDKAWYKLYWKPWKKYLAQTPKDKTPEL